MIFVTSAREPEVYASLLEGVEFELSGDSLSVSKPCKSVKKF